VEDVEGEGEVSGDPHHSALPVQVALSVPHGGHDEPVGSNAPKRLSNDVGRVVAVGDSHPPVGSNPGKKGGNAENQGGQSVFLNCLESNISSAPPMILKAGGRLSDSTGGSRRGYAWSFIVLAELKKVVDETIATYNRTPQESLDNVSPNDVFAGRKEEILQRRKRKNN